MLQHYNVFIYLSSLIQCQCTTGRLVCLNWGNGLFSITKAQLVLWCIRNVEAIHMDLSLI